MNSVVLYFIKSGLAMGLFYGVYRLFMEKETNYSLNRFYLVGTIILALVLPVLPLERLFMAGKLASLPVIFINPGNQGIADASVSVGNASAGGWHISGFVLARILYLSGVVILVLTLFTQMLRLLFIRRTARERYGPLRIIFVGKDIAPFSILNRVFVSHEIRRNPKITTILDHEFAHFRYLHFVDLIILEFITIFQWFNPFAWLYVRSLKEIHEYQADAAVLRSGEGTGSYQALLVNQLTGTEVFRLANGFSKSLTKKRMIMMTKMKSKKGAWLKGLLAMPVLAVLLIAYAANSSAPPAVQEDYVVKGKVVEAATGEAIPGVNVIWQGTTTGTSTDINGNFTLHVKDKNAVVVYSFVGFVTAITRGAGDFTVKMERKVFEISGNADEKASGEMSKEKKEYLEQEKRTQEKITREQMEKEKALGSGESTDGGEVFYVVEDMPKFQGQRPDACKKYVQENLEYPQEAKEKGINGIVKVEFLVNAKGQVKDAKVVRGVDPLLDKAALKAVYSMPDWEPGKQGGKNVSVLFVIPVEFRLGAE
jgi:TonB family protein